MARARGSRHVSIAPSKIPDGEISPIRFQVQHPASVFRRSTCSPFTEALSVVAGYSHRLVFQQFGASPRAPSLYPHYRNFIATMNPCASPRTSFHLRFQPRHEGLCSYSQSEDHPSFDAPALLECYAPYAGRSTGITRPLLPRLHRPSPKLERLGSFPNPWNATLPKGSFRRCRHSFMLWPSSSLALLIAPTRILARAARTLSPELAPDSLPPRKSGQLADRSGQWPAWNFHPLVDTCYWLHLISPTLFRPGATRSGAGSLLV